MMHKGVGVVVLLLGVLAAGLSGIAQQPATEAPAGFDTPTLAQNPGSQSKNNGIVEPTGDTFALDQQVYERVHDVSTGLGPIYNGRACAECHQNPVSGGASQFTELRVGHTDANGNFVNPTVLINDGANSITGRSIINDRAVIPQAQEHIPVIENIRALRAALNTLGDGFVEAIDDTTLQAIAAKQPELSEGRIHGEAIEVPVLESPGQTRVGRFGWKDQHSSLLSFIGDAYLNEMGVTNRLRPKDTTTVGEVTPDRKMPPTTGLGRHRPLCPIRARHQSPAARYYPRCYRRRHPGKPICNFAVTPVMSRRSSPLPLERYQRRTVQRTTGFRTRSPSYGDFFCCMTLEQVMVSCKSPAGHRQQVAHRRAVGTPYAASLHARPKIPHPRGCHRAPPRRSRPRGKALRRNFSHGEAATLHVP